MSATRATSRKSRELQAKNAAAHRWNHPNKDDIARQYAAERLAEIVADVVAAAPPLSDEQCARIAALLRCGGGQPAADRAAVVADRLADLDGGAA